MPSRTPLVALVLAALLVGSAFVGGPATVALLSDKQTVGGTFTVGNDIDRVTTVDSIGQAGNTGGPEQPRKKKGQSPSKQAESTTTTTESETESNANQSTGSPATETETTTGTDRSPESEQTTVQNRSSEIEAKTSDRYAT